MLKFLKNAIPSISKKPKVLVILGPTATGKTSLSIELAHYFSGEIISADSRQVYRGLDIGTAKITQKEMKGIPHHMIDVADPREMYTVENYVKDAQKAITAILARKNLPIICGGSGMYIDALVSGHVFPKVPPNPTLRKELEHVKTDDLVKRLEKLDRKRANSIDTKNRVRLIRAIEIAHALGVVPPLVSKSSYRILYLGLDIPKDQHSKIIRQRIITRDTNNALTDEVRELKAKGVSINRLNELGLEYRYVARYLVGELAYQEMIQQLTTKTIQFAKRQRTWFKKNKKIHWYDPFDDKQKIIDLVENFLKS